MWNYAFAHVVCKHTCAATCLSRCGSAGGADILHARCGQLHQHRSLVCPAGYLQPDPANQDSPPPLHWLEVSQLSVQNSGSTPLTPPTAQGMQDSFCCCPVVPVWSVWTLGALCCLPSVCKLTIKYLEAF